MIAGAAFLLAANAAAILLAIRLARPFLTGRAEVDLLVLLVMRFAVIALTVTLAGVAGFLDGVTLGIAAVGALPLLFALKTHRRLASLALPSLSRVQAAVLAAIALKLFLQTWFFSPHLGDAVNYYLPKVAEWIHASGFTREMGNHPHVTFPAGFEVFEAWWVVFLRHDLLIELAGVEFLALGGAATYSLARYLGVGDRAAGVAGLLYVLMPGANLAATSCLNDLAAGALVLATFALAAHRASFSLLILTAGLGLGIKPTYGYAIPGILLIMSCSRKIEASGSAGRAAMSAATASGIALGLFWYVRNCVWFGYPFYPLGSPEPPIFPPPQFGPKLSSLAGNFLNLIDLRVYDRHAFGAMVDDMAGWGPCAFAVGLAATVEMARLEPRSRTLCAAFAASLASVLLLVIHDAWCLKYAFFFPALLFAAAAWLIERAPSVKPIAVLGGAYCFVATLLPYDLPEKSFRALADQSWRERSAIVLQPHEGRGESIGFFGAIHGRAYLYYGSDFTNRVVYLRSRTAGALIEDMKSQGITLLQAIPATEAQGLILEACVIKGSLRKVGLNLFRRTGA
jgi:hypothetical protein